jgi:hypothetical protein
MPMVAVVLTMFMLVIFVVIVASDANSDLSSITIVSNAHALFDANSAVAIANANFSAYFASFVIVSNIVRAENGSAVLDFDLVVRHLPDLFVGLDLRLGDPSLVRT